MCFPWSLRLSVELPVFPTISFSSPLVYLSLSLSLSLSSRFSNPFFIVPSPFYSLLLVGLPFWPRFLIWWDPLHISKLTPLEIVLTFESMLGERISPRHYMVFSVMSRINLYCTVLGPPITWSVHFERIWLM